MLWFTRVIERTERRPGLTEVLDVLVEPPLGEDESLATFSCRVDGRWDTEIAALVHLTQTEYYEDVRQAWRLNRQSGRLEHIPTHDVSCANDGWGV